MKKSILTSIIAIAFAMPAIAANIPNDATCNSGVLGVSSGSANLEADYTANTINITWDGNGGSTPTGGATSCTYDSTFNLPAAPTKTGYTFAGWAVQAAQSCFANFPNDLEFGSTSRTLESREGQNGTWRVEMISGVYSDALGDYETIISHGIVSGISKCSSTEGDWEIVGAGTPSDENGRYCWCQVSTYTPNGGSQCNVASPAWVGGDVYDDADSCMTDCVNSCSGGVTFDNPDSFRRALFGI